MRDVKGRLQKESQSFFSFRAHFRRGDLRTAAAGA